MSAVASYRNQIAQSATLAKELVTLEATNRERTRRSLHKTLAVYGAEEDINQWSDDAKGTHAQQEIDQFLDDRWSSVSTLVRERERMELLIQQKLSHPIGSVKNDYEDDEMDANLPDTNLLPVVPEQPRPPSSFGFTAETEREKSVLNDNQNSYLKMVPKVLNQWVEAKLAASSHYPARPSLLSTQMDVDATNARKLSDRFDTHREKLKVTSDAESNGELNKKLIIDVDEIDHDDSEDEGLPLNDDNPYTMLEQAQSFLGQDTVRSLLKSIVEPAGRLTNHCAKSSLTAPEQNTTASAIMKKDSAVAVSNDPSPDVKKTFTKQGRALVHLVDKGKASDPESEIFSNQSGLGARDNLLRCQMLPVPSIGATKPLAILERPIYIGFVLQRPDDQLYWGLTLSLFDNKVLIVGHIRQQTVKAVTKQAKAGYIRPWTGGLHPHPDTFLDGFQNQIPGQHELKPGDVILSINSRPTTTFPTLIAVTDYLKRFGSLCLEVFRAQAAPDNPYDYDSYDMTRYVYTSLQINNLMHLATGDNPGNPSDSIKGRMASKSMAQLQIMQPVGENSPQNIVIQNVGFDGVCQPESAEIAKRTSRPPTTKRHHSSTKLINPLYNDARDDSTKADEFSTKIPRHCSSKKITNPMSNIPFDSTLADDNKDGHRSKNFLVDMNYKNFPTWLSERKHEWIEKRRKDEFAEGTAECQHKPVSDTWRNPTLMSKKGQFLSNGDNWDNNPEYGASAGQYLSELAPESSHLDHNQKRIREEEIVHFPSPGGKKGKFDKWLVVRKKQWSAARRKRSRLSKLEKPLEAIASGAHLNVLLEEECGWIPTSENDFKVMNLFFGTEGASDDIVIRCLEFLHPSEHGKLLTISKKTSENFKRRDTLWRKLCCRWDLPAKPRKHWHEIYITRIRKDEEEYRSQADEILHKAAVVLFKGDHLQKMEKIIATSQNRFDFDINHTCSFRYERNSILNLAVISQRHNIVKWLIETQDGIDLETRNKGGFTPLMNAAWAEDHYLVRLLIERGCDSTKIGTAGRYTF